MFRIAGQTTVLATALLGVLATAGPPTARAQTPQTSGATISGRVIDRVTQLPLGAVRVSIVGTTRATPTNDQGQYRLLGLTPGTYTVRTLRLGYESAAQTVTLTAGQNATADFALAPSA